MRPAKLSESKADALFLDFEVGIYENVIAREPENIEALFALGNAYTKRGRYEDGLAIDMKLVRLMPEDGTVRYNLACSYSLLGDAERALEELGNAIELGYDDMDLLRTDPDLENARRHPRFTELISMLEDWGAE
jgi:tetratricopeptide (TPR) repeat protein